MSLFTQNKKRAEQRKFQHGSRLTVTETAVYAMFGVLMFCSKLLMEAVPNVHPLAMFTVLLTVVYRKKALIPVYLYLFLNGLYAGFAVWWLPYLYLWTILWGAAMLLPQNMPSKVASVVYPSVCFLHGILFGTLYAPAQAIFFHFTWKQTLAWIVSGLPFDVIHGLGNLAAGLLVYPLIPLLRRLNRRAGISVS